MQEPHLSSPRRGSLARHYDRVSWLYDVLDWPYERFLYRRIRPLLCGDLSGRVLEAGVGTGRNLAYYAKGAEVTGIDSSSGQLKRARRRAKGAACSVELLAMDVTHLEFDDAHFDACVATFLFCVLGDDEQLPALEEMLRVVRPGGTIRLLDYVYSERLARRLSMKATQPWVRWVFRARFDRPTREAVRASGAELVDERYLHADTIRLFELRRPVDFKRPVDR